MYPYRSNFASASFQRQPYHPQYQYQQRQQPFSNAFAFIPFSLNSPYEDQVQVASSSEDTDEEELALLAALERKRKQKRARQQYRLQQQAEQEQYEELMQRRYFQAVAQAKAQHEAEQEAIRQYQLQQKRKEQQRLLAYYQQHELAQAQARARKNQHVYLTAAVADDSSDDEDPLTDLLSSLFFTNVQSKRQQPQESNYPCKRRSHSGAEKEHERRVSVESKAVQKDAAPAKTTVTTESPCHKRQECVSQSSAEATKTSCHKRQGCASQGTPEAFFGNIIEALPEIQTLLEAVFGAENDKIPSSPAATASATTNKTNTGVVFREPTSTSPADSSPELKAADILRERQQRIHKQEYALQQKHSELNLIESTLDDLSRELAVYLANGPEDKPLVLLAEEKVTKTMFKVDTIDSEGNLSVRKRRKELITKSQSMLDLVDAYKNKEQNTGKKPLGRDSESPSTSAEEGSDAENAPEIVSASEDRGSSESESEVEPYVVELSSEPKTLPQDAVQEVQDETSSLSDSVTIEEEAEGAEAAIEEPKDTAESLSQPAPEQTDSDFEVVSA